MTLLRDQLNSLLQQYGLPYMLTALAQVCATTSNKPTAHQDDWCDMEAALRKLAAAAETKDLEMKP